MKTKRYLKIKNLTNKEYDIFYENIYEQADENTYITFTSMGQNSNDQIDRYDAECERLLKMFENKELYVGIEYDDEYDINNIDLFCNNYVLNILKDIKEKRNIIKLKNNLDNKLDKKAATKAINKI